MLRLISSISLFLFIANVSIANDHVYIKVDYNDKVYSTVLNASINTSPNALYKILTSYNELNKFSQLIHTSQLLPNGQLSIQLRTCFAFLCFDKQQTLALTVGKYSISGEIIAEKSDFKSGSLKWNITEINGKSNIQFSSEMTPDFWVPPFIGPLLIKHKLHREALYSIKKIESLSTLLNTRQ